MTDRPRLRRPRKATPEATAKERAVRDRFQDTRPGLSDLLASGDYTEPVSQAEYWELRQICVRLKVLRESAGLSLTDMASRTGIDKAALSRLENGGAPNPTINTLARYAEALGKQIEVRIVTTRR